MDEYDTAFYQAVSECRTKIIPHTPLKESLACLGDKINDRYLGYRERLETPDETARIARKWLWILGRASQLFTLKLIADGELKDTPKNRRYAEEFEAGYGGDLGWAFGDGLANLKCIEAIESDHPGLSPKDLLEAISLAWFCEADDLVCAGDTKGAMAKIVDAMSAREQATSIYFYEEGFEGAKEEEPRPAAQLARRRHDRNYRLREKAIRHWREHIDASLSASRAAERLLPLFPVSHRTLSEWISMEKKKTSS